jgi:hypothetical protein
MNRLRAMTGGSSPLATNAAPVSGGILIVCISAQAGTRFSRQSRLRMSAAGSFA